MKVQRTTPRVETVYLELQVEPPAKKGVVAVTLDSAYQRPLLVIDAQGPSMDDVTYVTLSALKDMPKRRRTRLLKKCNLAVPVAKMTELVKAYPRYVGARKCQGLLEVSLGEQALVGMRKVTNLKMHKNAIKISLGRSDETDELLSQRIKTIVEKLRGEGYVIKRVMRGTTQGGSEIVSL